MPQHIKPHDNKNQPIVDLDNNVVPLVYFNHVKLSIREEHQYHLREHETVVAVVTGSINVSIDGETYTNIGKRSSLWKGKPEGIYAGKDSNVIITALRSATEVYIAGGKIEERHPPLCINQEEVDTIQYGSDESKTHRKIYHILGKNGEGRSGRLLVSELFTVGCGGWSGFPPHKHDKDRLPLESRFEEVYQFRFNPPNGFGAQFVYNKDGSNGSVFHVKDQSTILIDKGYHPSVVAPGYQMYYFTIIVGASQRSLTQYFHPDQSHQLETIPGIKDMINHFK